MKEKEGPSRSVSKPVTLKDMAVLAGVNIRTVGDAIRGTGRVAPATRENVLRIAKELNYIPNASARALVTGRTGKIAVLSGALTHQYYANTVHLLDTHLTSLGYEMVLIRSEREFGALIHATEVSRVDGVIVIGIEHPIEDFLRSSSSIQPCVLIDTSSPSFMDHITLNLRPAVEEALGMMLAMGRSRIAYVVNDRGEDSAPEVRRTTYLETMARAGHVPEIIDVNTNFAPEQRIHSLKSYFERNGSPDAIFCQNDESAIYCYQALMNQGRKIPDDVMLVGCDGLPYMEYFETPLSTIALPMEEVCALASQFLQRRISKPELPVQEKVLDGKLIVRKSLMALPV